MGAELEGLCRSFRSQFNDDDSIRKKWGGGIVGRKSQHIIAKREKALAEEQAKKIGVGFVILFSQTFLHLQFSFCIDLFSFFFHSLREMNHLMNRFAELQTSVFALQSSFIIEMITFLFVVD